ncbi:hypothetical protein [Streptomyces sp. NBC_00038]|uniref:hypothetical protein n=1 Tax=Streptomyces sp. NBC_00038 TaxID=2903615 RepID=UPI002259FA50|nr:hypothetical protein [Streptomyces sp. NBC_00038]MCX5562698.1 hypothetical protein [Streptomyces sp. NBC_00038]
MKLCTICDEPIRPDEPHKRHTSSKPSGGMLPTFFTHDRCRQRPTTVPFIATWSAENTLAPPTIVSRLAGGIGYVGEVPDDRDRGVLWRRSIDLRGRGRPLYGDVHPGRQRLAMRHELCQVCGEPANFDPRGTLWLLEDRRTDYPAWPNDLMTTHPPICRPCVRIARAQCPHLWAGAVAVLVGRSEVCGVVGQQYAVGPFGPRHVRDDTVLFEEPAIDWTIASQLIRALYDCTFVSLAELAAARP